MELVRIELTMMISKSRIMTRTLAKCLLTPISNFFIQYFDRVLKVYRLNFEALLHTQKISGLAIWSDFRK